MIYILKTVIISDVTDDGASSSTAPPQDLKVEMDNKPETAAQPIDELMPEVETTEDAISRIRAGWTLEDANSISIGELYLMVCSFYFWKMFVP